MNTIDAELQEHLKMNQLKLAKITLTKGSVGDNSTKGVYARWLLTRE